MVERTTRRLLRLAAADGSADGAAAESGRLVSEDYAGFVTRAIAFAIDVALIDLAAVIVAIVVGLGLSALDVPDVVVTIAVVVGRCGVLRVVRELLRGVLVHDRADAGRARHGGRRRVRERRGSVRLGAAVVRLAGMVLAAIPLCAGFLLILVDDRLWGLQDRIARTVVVYAPDVRELS